MPSNLTVQCPLESATNVVGDAFMVYPYFRAMWADFYRARRNSIL